MKLKPRTRDLTDEQVFERFESMVTLCLNPKMEDRTVPGVCDECGRHGRVKMYPVDGPRGEFAITARCADQEKCGA